MLQEIIWKFNKNWWYIVQMQVMTFGISCLQHAYISYISILEGGMCTFYGMTFCKQIWLTLRKQQMHYKVQSKLKQMSFELSANLIQLDSDMFGFSGRTWDTYMTRQKRYNFYVSFFTHSTKVMHCVKNVQIRSFTWSEYGKIRTRRNSLFRHFSRSDDLINITAQYQIGRYFQHSINFCRGNNIWNQTCPTTTF